MGSLQVRGNEPGELKRLLRPMLRGGLSWREVFSDLSGSGHGVVVVSYCGLVGVLAFGVFGFKRKGFRICLLL